MVITGGGGTLGGAIAEGFARAGAKVVLWGRTRSHLAARAAAIEAAEPASGRPVLVEVDLSSETAAERAVAETRDLAGGFSVLVNAAGGTGGVGPLTSWSHESYGAVVDLNLMAGCVLPTNAAARSWIDDGVTGASVINIASMGAHVPLRSAAPYSAAKAAVVSATQAAAAELAASGIRVNAISPGFFVADQNRALLIDETTGKYTPRGAAAVERTPFGRFGVPEEVVGACLFLASPTAAAFVTGVVLPVDGGYLVDNV